MLVKGVRGHDYSTYSSTSLPSSFMVSNIEIRIEANVKVLGISRLCAVVLEAYRSLKRQHPPFLPELFFPNQNHYDMKCQMIQPKFRTETYEFNSFRYQRSGVVRKSLPTDMKVTPYISPLKNILLEWYGDICLCGFCTLRKLTHLWCPSIGVAMMILQNAWMLS